MSALIVEEPIFALMIEFELRKAVRLRYPVSVMSIRPDPEGGGEISNRRHLGGQLARTISPVIRETDLISLSHAWPGLRVLLVDAAPEHLDGISRRLREAVRYHRFEINGEPRPVSLREGRACFPTTASRAENLLAQADGASEADEGGARAEG